MFLGYFISMTEVAFLNFCILNLTLQPDFPSSPAHIFIPSTYLGLLNATALGYSFTHLLISRIGTSTDFNSLLGDMPIKFIGKNFVLLYIGIKH